jgi:hypothetical protein
MDIHSFLSPIDDYLPCGMLIAGTLKELVMANTEQYQVFLPTQTQTYLRHGDVLNRTGLWIAPGTLIAVGTPQKLQFGRMTVEAVPFITVWGEHPTSGSGDQQYLILDNIQSSASRQIKRFFRFKAALSG